MATGDDGLSYAAPASLDLLVEMARSAGEIALRYFTPGGRTTARVDLKAGGSPVTEADLKVDRYLRERLGAHFPGLGWVSEETADDLVRLSQPVVAIVDPIDGTRGFAAGDTRWAVSLAIVADGRPVAGVVHAPALDETYAAAVGRGAALNGVRLATSGRSLLPGARAAGPKPEAAALTEAGVPVDLAPRVPSLAYRLVQVASGVLDVALAGRDAHDWDIAAADLIVCEAGGAVTDRHGEPPRYNRRSQLHPVLYACPAPLQAALLRAVQKAATGRVETPL